MNRVRGVIPSSHHVHERRAYIPPRLRGGDHAQHGGGGPQCKLTARQADSPHRQRFALPPPHKWGGFLNFARHQRGEEAFMGGAEVGEGDFHICR